MNDTYMTIVGNLTDDLELRYTAAGVPWSSFRVASTPRHYDRAQEKWVDGQPTFLSVTVWRGLAINAAASLRKGHPVVVHGRFQQREYESNEQKRIAYGLEAIAVGHDLSRGVAAYEKRAHALAPGVAVGEDGLPVNEGARFAEPDGIALPSVEPDAEAEDTESDAMAWA
ncbi:MAG: single-stranded DNA-binding protein [Jatrophihabitans sp.]|uniref:single-stranded DNA-binding protein n=1 Tax=Jatrophihabitans sp. TaxID=1932789 RepID=UPI003F81CBC7